MPESENPEDKNSTTENSENETSESSSNSSPTPSFETERKVARQWVQQRLLQWMPLGGSGFAFVSLLLKEEPFIAILMFPVMAISIVWAKYTDGFLNQLGEVAAKRGKEDVDALVGWKENIDEAIRWQLAGTEGKYLQCQGNACRDYATEGLTSTFKPLLKDVFVPLELSGDFSRGVDGEALPMPPGLKRDKQLAERLASGEGLRIWNLLERGKGNSAYRSLAILAWGGYGKTTLLRHITYLYTQKRQPRQIASAPKLLPVLLYLRRWQEVIHTEKPDLPTLIEKHHIPNLSGGKDLKLPPNWAKNQLRQDNMLVMFDGFDEVREEWQKPMSRWIAKQIEAYPQSFFILTSRPGGYKNYAAEHKPNSVFVKPFNDDQQERFVRCWYLCRERHYSAEPKHPRVKQLATQKAASLMTQIRERGELHDLAKNPLLLSTIVNLHSYAPSDPIDPSRPIQLPQRRAELYREIFRLQLGDRPLVKQINLLLSAEDSQKILQKLALAMVKENKPNIEKKPLLAQLKSYLNGLDGSVEPTKFLQQIEQVSELLVKRDIEYEFAHLSFQGYLAAREIQELQQERLLLEHWQKPWWKETILLYAAQVSTHQLSHLVRQLCGVGTREAVALAYDCLKETPRKVSPAVAAELERLKSNVRDLRYQKLEAYLSQGEWRKADEETSRLMLQTMGKEEGQLLDIDDIENFPCEDLRTLNELWVKYSNGHFGFSVQKEIWIECGGKPGVYDDLESYEKFADRVGWRREGDWLYYNDLNFTIASDRGHLPQGIWQTYNDILFSRVQTCEV
ncbi:GUN4 domain-containing protein [Oscillatoriales cyanobacterium LEGE 11467]|uniref:GUN4 domain-containing protein n=1 Tax=Zarconia navalis LEGE 11467 TaxID=1828826 RepID=A0A928VYH5_9CYAN|nr:GUN4 domain-containing protein [Zarconia navalis]MBE9040606.1 GUN4 domain-containing protein [Zarconia navalis LEGE 11467]